MAQDDPLPMTESQQDAVGALGASAPLGPEAAIPGSGIGKMSPWELAHGYGTRPPTAALAPGMSVAPEDLDKIVRTVYGEAGRGTQARQAVAAVIMNRARQAGMSPGQVALAKGQFEPWATRKAELESLDPNSALYKSIAADVAPVVAGKADPTNGATYFYSPGAQKALGREPPAWDNGKGVDIGGNRFFNLPYGSAVHPSRVGESQLDVTDSQASEAKPVQSTAPGSPAPTPQLPLLLLAALSPQNKFTAVDYDPYKVMPSLGV